MGSIESNIIFLKEFKKFNPTIILAEALSTYDESWLFPYFAEENYGWR